TMYTVTERFYPPSYVYGASQEGGDWRLVDQQLNKPNPAHRYIHWSWALFESGGVPETAFTCPALSRGGAPRTNPGQNSDDWEPGQINDMGSGPGSPIPLDRPGQRTGHHPHR